MGTHNGRRKPIKKSVGNVMLFESPRRQNPLSLSLLPPVLWRLLWSPALARVLLISATELTLRRSPVNSPVLRLDPFMATVASPADEATDLLQNLSLESKKTSDVSEVSKASATSGDAQVMRIPTYNRTGTPLLHDVIHPSASMWYPSTAYYYGGYDGLITEWEDYSRYTNPEGVEMPPHGIYGDMYQHGYQYAPYSPYPSSVSPVPTVGNDGHLYATQQYQYPPQYYQLATPTPASVSSTQSSISQPGASTTTSADKLHLATDTSEVKVNAHAPVIKFDGKNIVSVNSRPGHQSSGSYVRSAVSSGLLSSNYKDLRYGFNGTRSPLSWYNGSRLYDGKYQSTANGSGLPLTPSVGSNLSSRNQNNHALPHLMGLNTLRPASVMDPAAPAYVNRTYPSIQSYGECGSALRTNFGYGSNTYDARISGRWGYVSDCKFKPRGRSSDFYDYGNENFDGLSEMNKGPRSNRSTKPLKGTGLDVTTATKGQNFNSNGSFEENAVIPSTEQWNKEDFPEKYSDAKFFIIKSYSEDDVHKSVKYSVWTSTPNGNKKLDAAYKEAKKKPDSCPVFLFFSVNTSGQFVGIAEMVGSVDFEISIPYWQQDKWNGCFPVKWHIVKDVPNGILKHIILDNNEGKPVTNSRDTQEVMLDQGIQMLKIFKEHVSKTSIMDDFGFYDTRQKLMMERRAQRMQRQTPGMKMADSVVVEDKEGSNGKIVSLLKKENDLPTATGDASPVLVKPLPSSGKPVIVENGIVSNGN